MCRPHLQYVWGRRERLMSPRRKIAFRYVAVRAGPLISEQGNTEAALGGSGLYTRAIEERAMVRGDIRRGVLDPMLGGVTQGPLM